MTETRYQRVAREQRERQAARAKRRTAEIVTQEKTARKHARWAKDSRRERAYLDAITSDHDHSMDY